MHKKSRTSQFCVLIYLTEYNATAISSALNHWHCRVLECPFDNLVPLAANNGPVQCSPMIRNTVSGDNKQLDRNGKPAAVDKAVLSFADDDEDDEDDEDEDEGGIDSINKEKESNSSLQNGRCNSADLGRRRPHPSAKSLESRKRARRGIVSSHDVLVDDPTLHRAPVEHSDDDIWKEAIGPTITDQTKALRKVTHKAADSRRTDAEILAAAEREFQELKAKSTKRPSSAGASAEVHVDDPRVEPPLDLMPAKYAKLQRGVSSENQPKLSMRKDMDSAAARLHELKLRVRSGIDAGLARHLVFRNSAGRDGERDDEYSVIDPLDGSRGRGVRKPGL
jgi:hypothetical protein